MKVFGQKLFAVNNYPTGVMYTFKFNNKYEVEVTENKRKNYYTATKFDNGKTLCYGSSSWLDREALTNYLSKIETLGEL